MNFIRNSPAVLISIVAMVATFLLGCGGGGSSPGGTIPPVTGFAATSLSVGTTINLSGTYSKNFAISGLVGQGNVSKNFVVTDATSGTFTTTQVSQSLPYIIGTNPVNVLTPSNYTYSTTTANTGVLTAPNYPCGYDSTPQSAILTLTFTSKIGGTYTEGGLGYTGSGTFTATFP